METIGTVAAGMALALITSGISIRQGISVALVEMPRSASARMCAPADAATRRRHTA